MTKADAITIKNAGILSSTGDTKTLVTFEQSEDIIKVDAVSIDEKWSVESK